MGLRLSTGLRNAIMGSTGFVGAMNDGVIDIYSGTIPADADTTEGSGTKLLRVTVDGGAFTSGAATNGLGFNSAASGAASKADAETWQGEGLASGTAAWFRFYANTVVTGASTTAVRFDGTVGTSGADLILTSTSIVSGATTTIDSATFTLPAS